MLGTNYRNEMGGKGATIDSLILDVAKVLASHHCGLLVIDEIQNLLDASGIGQAKMINNLVYFANEAKIPTFVIGTPRALSLLEKTFREARRAGDHGSFVWDAMPSGVQYSHFLKALWEYQWVGKHVKLTNELARIFHQLTQGIPVLIVRLFQLSQLQAIRDGSERLTKDLITGVAHEKFKLIAPMLHALRTGNKKAIRTYEDLLHKGLNEIKEDVVDQGRIAKLREEAQKRNQGAADLIRTVSILMQMNFEQDPTQKVVETLFNTHPNLTCDKAVRLFLESVDAQKGGNGGPTQESLKDVVQKEAASGIAPIDALKKAGFVFPSSEEV
jgi:hypothetical protein